MRKFLLPFLAIVAASAHAQIVTNTIDTFGNAQTVSVITGAATNTVAAAGAIGGYRTMVLTATDNENELPISLNVSATTKRLILSTPSSATASFSVTWGGLGGTNGLGGVDLIAGNPSPLQSNMKFSLRSADFSSSFTWTFIDTASQTASYTGTFPVETSTAPDLAYNIALSSFTGAINWNSINFITLSGGGTDNLDLDLSAPITMETTMTAPVPEPGTWAAAALLAGLAGFIHWRRRRANA
jgi:MYXO-CTERM domain-containing protein